MSQPVENNEVKEGEKPEGTSTENSTENKLSYEQLESELKKVRSEAASRRIALREQEEAAKKWAEYEESQKTELQKLQDQLAERDKALASKDVDILRTKIAKEFNVADDDLDLLVGDEENMKRLAAKIGKQETNSSPPPFFGGNRGKPVGKSGESFDMESFIRGLK